MSNNNNTDPPLPPLNNQKRGHTFAHGNHYGSDAAAQKRQRIEDNDPSLHPSQWQDFKTHISKHKQLLPSHECEFKNTMIQFLNIIKEKQTGCQDPKRKSNRMNCNCVLRMLQSNNIEKIATAVTEFHSLHVEARKAIISTKVQCVLDTLVTEKQKRNITGCVFSIPGLFYSEDQNSNKEQNKPFLCCRYGFSKIMGLNNSIIDTIKMKYKDSMSKGTLVSLDHGLKGRTGNKKDKDVEDSLEIFFDILEGEAEPYASRVVRGEVGKQHLRENELNGVALPPKWSHRSLYERWIYSCGYIAKRKKDGKSNYDSLKNFDQRPLGVDEEYLAIGSYFKFIKFWKENKKHIKIARKASDTCDTCWKQRIDLAKLDRAIAASENSAGEDRNDIDEEDEACDDGDLENERVNTDQVIDEEESNVEEEGAIRSNVTNNTCVINYNAYTIALKELRKKHIIEMGKHMEAFDTQRSVVNYFMALAKSESHLPFPEKTTVLVGDYAQNLDLPHFGKEQPGKLYFFSPLGLYIFGLVDCSTDKMTAFTYKEGEAKKGGNNVTSLIYKWLKDNNIVKMAEDQGPGKRLVLVFDNCGGQNKNRMVLRFGQYLVDIGLFKEVQILFLVAGHTKNICDRLFKCMKSCYHDQNIYTFQQAVDALNMRTANEGDEKDHVNVSVVDRNDMYDWDKFLDKFYIPTITGIQKKHWFSYSIHNDGVMYTRDIATDVSSQKGMYMRMMNLSDQPSIEHIFEWIERLKSTFPQLADAPGIKPIKLVEMYTKWREFIPPMYQDDLCPKPSDEIIESVKKKRNQKSREYQKKKRKKRAEPEDDN